MKLTPQIAKELAKKYLLNKKTKDGKFDGLDMHFSCSLGDIAEEIIEDKHPEGLML